MQGILFFFFLSVGEEGVSARVAGGEGACGVREHARSLSRPGGLSRDLEVSLETWRSLGLSGEVSRSLSRPA